MWAFLGLFILGLIPLGWIFALFAARDIRKKKNLDYSLGWLLVLAWAVLAIVLGAAASAGA
jgi:hypothetical protein